MVFQTCLLQIQNNIFMEPVAQPAQTILDSLCKLKLKLHHPTDLVHGLLCEHCKHESLDAPVAPKNSNIHIGDKLRLVDRSKPGQKEGSWWKRLWSAGTHAYSEEDFIYRVFTRKLDPTNKEVHGFSNCEKGREVVEGLLNDCKAYKIIEDYSSSYYGVIYIKYTQ